MCFELGVDARQDEANQSLQQEAEDDSALWTQLVCYKGTNDGAW